MHQQIRYAAIAIPIAAVVVGGLVALSYAIWPTVSIRYRMTVTVDTPQGVRSGSSVIESTISDGPRFGDASGIGYRVKGEAVAVDISNGQTLFALLSKDGKDAADYHATLINKALAKGSTAEPPLPRKYAAYEWVEERRAAKRIKPSIVLPKSLYPRLARFRDAKNAKSVEFISPDDLAKSFGNGITLSSISVKVTDDPVTEKIASDLPKADSKGFFGRPVVVNGADVIEIVSSSDFLRSGR